MNSPGKIPGAYEVIIAGAGPGGSTCAYFLAKGGARVLLLEKKSFPREKLCAGGIPASTLNHLKDFFNFGDLIPLKSYFFTHQGNNRSEGPMPENRMYSVDRGSFDESLARSAEEAGAMLQEDNGVRTVEREGTGYRVRTQGGDSYHCDYFVGSDGGHSAMARQLGFFKNNPPDYGTCGAYEFRPSDKSALLDKNRVYLDFNFFKRGVTGIVPKEDHFWVGAYTAQKVKLESLERETLKYMETLGLKGNKGRFRGLYMPLYKGKRKVAEGNSLLVGEAARLVNPLSGEGIKPAVDSGRIAAEEILKGKGLKSYSKRIHDEAGKELDLARSFEKVAYTFPDFAYDGMIKVVGDAVLIMNGEMSYGDFLERLKKKILRKVTGIKL